MGKCLTAGMIGFLLGMKSKECGKKLCMKQIITDMGEGHIPIRRQHSHRFTRSGGSSAWSSLRRAIHAAQRTLGRQYLLRLDPRT